MTTGRIAFALGTVGVGALIGGAVAEHRDGDVARGALIGGASALAGLALLVGGAAAWKHLTAARTGATAGASALGTTLGHSLVAPPAAATSSTATAAATSGWRSWVGSLFQEASTAATLRPLPATVPAIARTPVLPVATTLPAAATSSGSTFLNAMTRFLPG